MASAHMERLIGLNLSRLPAELPTFSPRQQGGEFCGVFGLLVKQPKPERTILREDL